MARVKSAKKQFAVIGLGRFGTALTKVLYNEGMDVLAIDSDPEKVNAAEQFCTQAVCADAEDERVLTRLGINNFDAVVVCIGTDIEASVFITVVCKQLGAANIIAKAQDARHAHVLKKIGAAHVIIPEEEAGEKLALQLSKPNMIEILSLTDNFRLVEIKTPEKWRGKTLMELNVRSAEKVSVMLIKRGENIIVAPGGDCMLLDGDTLVIAGETADTERLSKKATKAVE
ncbi:MAG: TrkA family potassium uptake protein [Clostridiales bacterium]|jgi:trk system potassium uptake protein TrkA|nr:TrkA family potassium uptake protein [Clostridiales bacterium]